MRVQKQKLDSSISLWSIVIVSDKKYRVINMLRLFLLLQIHFIYNDVVIKIYKYIYIYIYIYFNNNIILNFTKIILK